MRRFAWIAAVVGVVSLAMWLGGPVSGEAATNWYMAIAGNDGNACTSLPKACGSIQGVINKAGFASGDTIKVFPGTYSYAASHFQLFANNNVIIQGILANLDCSGQDDSGVSGPPDGQCEIRGNGNVMTGFTVRRGWVKLGFSPGTDCNDPTVASIGNRVHLNTFLAAKFSSTADAYTGGTGVEVRDCNNGAVVNPNTFGANAANPDWYVFLLINNNWTVATMASLADWDLTPVTVNLNTFDGKGLKGRSAMVLCSEGSDGSGSAFLEDGSFSWNVAPVNMGTNFFKNGALLIGTVFGSRYCPPK